MSTANKLTYLNNTKQLLKQKINNLGGDITDNTTFRQYSDELQDVYDNLPKATGEGTEVSLNTVKGRMLINEKGNTIQDGTPTPNNEVPIKVVTGENTVIVGGINKYSSEIEQGGFFSTGLNADSNNRIRSKDYIEVKPNTTYTISANTITSNTLQVSISEYTQNDYTTPRINSTAWTTLPYTFTTQSNTKYIRNLFKFSNENNLVPSDVNLVQLQTGSTATPYEPYISPISKQLDLGDIELAEIGTVNDVLFHAVNGDKYYDSLSAEDKATLDVGDWYKSGKIGKVVFSNNDSFTENYSSSSRTGFTYTIDNIKPYTTASEVPKLLTTKFIAVSMNASWNKYNMSMVNYSGSQRAVVFLIEPNKTVTDIHIILDGEPLYYLLENVIYTKITNTSLISQLEDIDNLMSNNGTTIISTSSEEGNANLILSVSALKGT